MYATNRTQTDYLEIMKSQNLKFYANEFFITFLDTGLQDSMGRSVFASQLIAGRWFDTSPG